jgi:hypothetical protein
MYNEYAYMDDEREDIPKRAVFKQVVASTTTNLRHHGIVGLCPRATPLHGEPNGTLALVSNMATTTAAAARVKHTRTHKTTMEYSALCAKT